MGAGELVTPAHFSARHQLGTSTSKCFDHLSPRINYNHLTDVYVGGPEGPTRLASTDGSGLISHKFAKAIHNDLVGRGGDLLDSRREIGRM